MRTRAGVTLIEILVALFILTGVSGAIYFLVRDAGYRRGLALSRTQAQADAVKIFKALQEDLTRARAGTYAVLDVAAPEFGITLPEGPATVAYRYEPPRLVRTSTAPNQMRELTLSENLERFALTKSLGHPGQILVEIVTCVKMDGMTDAQAQRFTQNQVITMRADASQQFDSHWVDTGQFAAESAAQGSVIAGVAADTQADVENISVSSEFAAASAQQIEEKIQEIVGKLREIAGNLDEINRNIADVPPRKLIYDPGRGSIEDFQQQVIAGQEVKAAYVNMNTRSSLRWDRFPAIAHNRGRRDVSGEFQSFYNGKARMFDSGKKLIDLLQGEPFKKTAGQIEGLVGSSVYRRFL
ncbi:MAG: prepilin-type N-terminal cleavage/methylation domain-containing protein [Candidatus Riflebacteria bacterium]|nr:prepilin-type N-terminal cleavage/methylation domain-containing protein [Candidatus Riflebacteria bacterium]